MVTKPPKTTAMDTTTTTPVAAPEGSPQGATTPTPAATPADAKTPVLTPTEWAAKKGVDPALVAGAAVLAEWPAGNLREGSLLVSESDFDAALKAFTGMEIG